MKIDHSNPPKSYNSRTLLTLGLLAGLAASAYGQTTLLSTDFQSHATGAATEASLNAVTTGGTWALNTTPNNSETDPASTFNMVEDLEGSVGDKAVEMAGSTGAGTLHFATLSFGTAADFSSVAASFATEILANRAGKDRSVLFEFLGTDGNTNNLVAATVLFVDEYSFLEPIGADFVAFNGGTPSTLEYKTRPAWDADNANVHDLTAEFSGSSVSLSLGGVSSGSISVLNGVTQLTGFRISAVNGAKWQTSRAQGVFLDDITVTSGTAGNGDDWAGYPIDPDGWVDTTPFLGWIWVSDATDYVWSVNLGKFIYLPESKVTESGAWTYIDK